MKENINEKELEELRHKAKIRTYITYVFALLSFPLGIWFFYNFTDFKQIQITHLQQMQTWVMVFQFIILSCVVPVSVLGLLYYFLVSHYYKKFNTLFKSKYIIQTISEINGFDNLEYTMNNGFTWDEVRNSAVVNCGEKNLFESEDLLSGTYQNVRFKISDVITKRLVRDGKNTKTEEIFCGQIICFFDFHEFKKSKGHVQIFEKNFLSNMAGWKAENKIYTESEEFNQKFSVYATDEHNAHYILTPQNIEKISSYEKNSDEQISVVYYDDKLFVAIKRESMFEASIKEPVSKQTKRIKEDAQSIVKAKNLLL